jgi:hypothetical protein
MKITDIIKESKKPKSDWDEEEDQVVDDPDSDRIPHIIMQMKKAIDNGGRSQIVFQDGDKVSLPLSMIVDFVSVYMMLKPYQREELQKQVSRNRDSFMNGLRKLKQNM